MKIQIGRKQIPSFISVMQNIDQFFWYHFVYMFEKINQF
jgi:hypothetical protein